MDSLFNCHFDCEIFYILQKERRYGTWKHVNEWIGEINFFIN